MKLSLNPVRNTAGNAVYYMVGSAGSIPTATTDVRGMAQFEGIPAGNRYTLRTKDKKYLQPKREPFEVSAGGVTRRELVVRESATLVVSVVGAAGTDELAMVRLEVKAVGSAKRKSRWVRGSQPRTDVYAPGRYEVRAQRYRRRRPAKRSPGSVTKPVELRLGKPTKIDIIVP